MSDVVILSLVAVVPSTIAAVLGFLNNSLGRKHELEIMAIREHSKETKDAITETKLAIVTLEKSTNGMKDALVKVTGESEFARGVKHGEDNPR